MSIRAVIFDLGHTLWDIGSYAEIEAEAYPRIARRLAEALDDPVPDAQTIMDAVHQRFIRDYVEALQGKLEQPPTAQLMDEALREVGVVAPPLLVDEVCELAFGRLNDAIIADESTLEVLRALRERGLRLGCITNTVLSGAQICGALAEHSLLELLDSVVVSADMGYRKPHSSLFERALADLGVEPAEAVFVGDRMPEDIVGAQAVGMRTVLTHQYRQEEPEGGAPDAVISHLREVVGWVERMASGSAD
ncbi:MAG: HAD family hydrolase [Candidatus Bathyarchaeota archaeon]|nr:HAD family hydrolase [Candidatus Bathyarchaeota archaeon]